MHATAVDAVATGTAASALDASVVIPSRAGRERLPRLLSALGAQQGATFEVIVVLDGDIDNSATLVDRWPRPVGAGPVRVITFPENQGRAAALNAGFAASAGRVLIRCDDDLEPGPDFVAAHVRFHQSAQTEHPRGGVGLCPDVFASDNHYGRVYGGPADERIRHWQQNVAADQAWQSWSGNVSVTAETYELVGPYDTSYVDYGWEDIQWGYRLHAVGRAIHVVPGADALHHNPPQSAHERAARAFDSGRARARFYAQFPQARAAASAPKPSVWNGVVAGLSRLITARTLPIIGAPVDHLIAVLPARWGEKSVALVVEAAGVAGDRRANVS